MLMRSGHRDITITLDTDMFGCPDIGDVLHIFTAAKVGAMSASNIAIGIEIIVDGIKTAMKAAEDGLTTEKVE